MAISVLGTEYKVNKYNYKDKREFEKGEICGYCDSIHKEIEEVSQT